MTRTRLETVIEHRIRLEFVAVGGLGSVMTEARIASIASKVREDLLLEFASLADLERGEGAPPEVQVLQDKAKSLANVFFDLRRQLEQALGEETPEDDHRMRTVRRIAFAALTASSQVAGAVADAARFI